jgi:hypothetical protein
MEATTASILKNKRISHVGKAKYRYRRDRVDKLGLQINPENGQNVL